MRSAPRAGFSLLEMLLATSVLLGCIIVLAELADIGTEHIDDIEGLSTAQLICRTTLNEMLSGAAPTESFQGREVEGRPGWLVSTEINMLRQPGVASLRVTAWYEDPESESLDQEVLRRHQFSLVRWTRDPHLQDATSPEAELPGASSLFESFSGDRLP